MAYLLLFIAVRGGHRHALNLVGLKMLVADNQNLKNDTKKLWLTLAAVIIGSFAVLCFYGVVSERVHLFLTGW